MNSNLNLLKNFYVVAKKMNISEAAKELYVSQPAISQSIHQLENMLNTKLLVRKRTGVVLTKEGKLVFSLSKKVHQLDIEMDALCKQISNQRNKVLKIGLSISLGEFYLSKFYMVFNKIYPDIRVEFIIKNSEQILDMLIERKLDIVIDTNIININQNEHLRKFQLLELHACFACCFKYKGFKCDEKILLKDLNKFPLLLPSKITTERKIIDCAFQSNDMQLNPLIEVNSLFNIKEMINNEVGIGWIFKDFIQSELDSQQMAEIKTDINYGKISLDVIYYDDFMSDNLRKFLKILKKYFLKNK